VYLGAQVPLKDLIAVVQTLRPALVCLSASTVESAAQLGQVARKLLESVPGLLFGYGGRVFNIHPEMREAMPGSFLGHDARELADRIPELLRRELASGVG
jgi:hypothetical protein